MEGIETIDIFEETPELQGIEQIRVQAASSSSTPLTVTVPPNFEFRTERMDEFTKTWTLERTTTTPIQEPRSGTRATPKRNLFAVSPVKQVSKKRTNEETIKTLVFFDFETSGLFPKEQNRLFHLNQTRCPADFVTELEKTILETQKDQYPRILELSFVAVARETFEKSIKKMEDLRVQGNRKLTIRVPCNIHTRQINPNMSETEWQQYEQKRSARNNPLAHLAMVHEKHDLHLKNSFAVEWEQVRQFLESCPKPACLVAHNGLKFDLRLLHGELARFNLLKTQALPQGILFVDSFFAIQNIEQAMKRRLCETLRSVDWKMISQLLITDEVTPNPRDHPLQFLNKTEWPTALFTRYSTGDFKKDSETGQWEFSPENKRFGLQELYESIFGETTDFHYAQDDSLGLMQICLSYGNEFLNYMDSTAAEVPF